VGLGSNQKDPRLQLGLAFAALETLPLTRLELRSSLYGSRPFGPVAQDDFCNAVAGLLTQLEPRELLAGLRALETRLGREPQRVRWGPRVIDLDLLVHGRHRIHEADLELPHPGIAARRFVLEPLAEIAPDLDVPGLGHVAGLLSRLGAGDTWRLA
jgi:2-amino-4-hydroxy-6-hydroxymethyldihydropteridine diphosphokinase